MLRLHPVDLKGLYALESINVDEVHEGVVLEAKHAEIAVVDNLLNLMVGLIGAR